MNVLLFANRTRNLSRFTPLILLWSLNNFVAWPTDWHGFSLRKHMNRHVHETSFLFELLTYVEVILMR